MFRESTNAMAPGRAVKARIACHSNRRSWAVPRPPREKSWPPNTVLNAPRTLINHSQQQHRAPARWRADQQNNGKLGFQYCRSPSKTLRTSERLRSAMGVSELTRQRRLLRAKSVQQTGSESHRGPKDRPEKYHDTFVGGVHDRARLESKIRLEKRPPFTRGSWAGAWCCGTRS